MTDTLTSFNILNEIEIDVQVESNPYGFALSDLFDMGARVNPKRSFLFISKLIGKHLDVHPDVPKATGHLLANLLVKRITGSYFSDTEKLKSFVQQAGRDSLGLPSVKEEMDKRHGLEQKTLFIGFAETATGLGHAVFSAFENALFVHTTREELPLCSIFNFEEEHSHAVDHRCYLSDVELLDIEQIVLIDDEMTTGKTTLNLIRSLHGVHPVRKYYVLSLLDWRTRDQEIAYKTMEAELGIEINTLSFVRGTIQLQQDTLFSYLDAKTNITEPSYRVVHQSMFPRLTWGDKSRTYLLDTGRFGLDSEYHDDLEKNCKEVAEVLMPLRKSDKRTLVMGVGEFMYLPSRIAAYMGNGVMYKSATRSPIYPSNVLNYPIKERLKYMDDDSVVYYMYNMEEKYDEVMLLFESEPSLRLKEELSGLLRTKGIPTITFVVL